MIELILLIAVIGMTFALMCFTLLFGAMAYDIWKGHHRRGSRGKRAPAGFTSSAQARKP